MNVYITGITGTVGQAFTKLLYDKHDIYGVDHNEERVAELKAMFPKVKVTAGDFQHADLKDMDVVIHLAAMKHINLCEENPLDATVNNVVKTLLLFREAKQNDTDILFMSTDKAVEPNSVYGYTKALGEKLALSFGGCFARSGNIIDSSGSLFQIWEKAIANNESICITHKDMKRYFITPDNLVKRIWERYINGEREIIPEMDSHVKLVDLAMELLGKHGHTLETYGPGIKYIGLRGGEKIEEKLKWEIEK